MASPKAASWERAEVWPYFNPSGLNAHCNLPEMAKVFREPRGAVGE